MSKKKVSISVDSDLWELAKFVIPNRSKFIENCLRERVESTDDIKDLENEINEVKNCLASKETQLKELKKIREKRTNNKNILDDALFTCRKIHDEHHNISYKQIESISRFNNIDSDVLIKELRNKDYKIVKYQSVEGKPIDKVNKPKMRRIRKDKMNN